MGFSRAILLKSPRLSRNMLLKLNAFDGFRRHHDGWWRYVAAQTEEIALLIKTFSAHHGEGLPLTHIAGLRTGCIAGRQG